MLEVGGKPKAGNTIQKEAEEENPPGEDTRS